MRPVLVLVLVLVPVPVLAAPPDAGSPSLVLVLPPARPIRGLAAPAVTDAIDLAIGDLGMRALAGPTSGTGTEDEQARAAREAGLAAGAIAVVWYTRADAGRVRVDVLDLRAGEAPPQEVDVDATADDAARVLALKVRHLIRYAPIPEPPPAAPRPPPPSVHRQRPARVRTSVGWTLAAGPSGLRHGPAGSFDVRALPRVEGRFALAFLETGELELETGTVRAQEATLALEAHGILSRRRGEASVGPTVRLHLVSASGETADGRHGSVRSAALEVGLVAGARVGIVPALALDAAVVLGWIIAPGRLLLGGREAFELGSLGFAIRLGFSSPGLQPEHPLGAPSGE